MEYEKAIEILNSLSNRHPLAMEEKEALDTAIGVLSLGSLALGKVRAKKARREKSTEW
jgi:hypothetical protein